MTTRWIYLASCVSLLMACAAPSARAQQFVPSGRDTLRGLSGIEVLVERLDTALVSTGLSSEAIAANVAAQLRSSGITVYPSQMQNPSPAKAYLYVNVSGFELHPQGYVFGIQAHVRQTVQSLVTRSNIVNAMTWDQTSVFFAPTDGAVSSVTDEVASLVGRFVEDWRATR